MTENVIVLLAGGFLGPFADDEKLPPYLEQLGVTPVHIIPIVTPPILSDLLVMARAYIEQHGEDTEGFLNALPKETLEQTSHEEIKAVFAQAAQVHAIASGEAGLSDAQLAALLLDDGHSEEATVSLLCNKRHDLGAEEAEQAVRAGAEILRRQHG